MSSSIYHGVEGEERVSRTIWRIIAKHYTAHFDSKNPSLMAQKLFAISRAIYNDVEIYLDKEYQASFEKKNTEIEELEAEIRQLKGLPPLPPVPTA